MSTSIFDLRDAFLARQVRCHFIWNRDAAQAGIPLAIRLCDGNVDVYPPSSENGWICGARWAIPTADGQKLFSMFFTRDVEYIADRILTRIKERRDAS